MNGLSPFVAVKEDVIVGYTDLQKDGLIDHFFCHHEYQGQGVGKALMQHVHEQAKQRAINKLHSEVSITARPFYEHFGFSVISEHSVEIDGQVLKYNRMEKRI